MSWSSPFRNRIAGRAGSYAPRFLIETVTPPTEIGHGNWTITSHDETVGSPLIGEGGGAIIGSEVRPRAWDSMAGAWSVPLTAVGPLLGKVWKGQLVRLRVGFSGWPVSAFEPVALGRVQGISGSPGRWQLDIVSIFTALQGRITATADEYALFSSVGTSTTLSSDYTAADGTVSVTSSAGFNRQDAGAGGLKGAFRITSDSGEYNYVTWTSVAANVFTVSSAGEFGSTDEDAASGAEVVEVAYIDDHPIDVVRRILVSTGTALANGTWDTLPELWGFGLDDSLIDHDDMGRWKPYTAPSAGSADWDIVVEDEQDNALSWLQGWLSLGGFFLAVRQGKITCRGCIDPRGSANALSTGVPYQRELTDEEIVAIDGIEYWDSAYQVEYRRHKVITSSNNTVSAEAITSLPAFNRYVTDLSAYVCGNEAAHRAVLADRLDPWVLRIPTRLSLTCAGLERAGLAAGDIVPISTGLARGRQILDREGYTARRAMVTRVAPDWWRGSVRLTLTMLPTTADEFA